MCAIITRSFYVFCVWVFLGGLVNFSPWIDSWHFEVMHVLRLTPDAKWLLVVYPPFPGRKQTEIKGCQLKIGTVPSRRKIFRFWSCKWVCLAEMVWARCQKFDVPCRFLSLVLVEPKAPCYRAHVCVRNSGFSRILPPTTRDHFRAMFVSFSYPQKTWRRWQRSMCSHCAFVQRRWYVFYV